MRMVMRMMMKMMISKDHLSKDRVVEELNKSEVPPIPIKNTNKMLKNAQSKFL